MTARVLAAGLLLLAGCYRKKTIVVPPSEHGVFCQQDAQMQHQICMLQQRGFVRCDELRDLQLLGCPGAYEVTGDAVVDAGEATTYQLPGFRP